MSRYIWTPSYFLPGPERVRMLEDKPTDRRFYSAWLGFSVGVINLAGVWLRGVWNTIKAFGAFLLVAVIQLIVLPLMWILGAIVLGLMGRLEIEGAEATDNQVTKKLQFLLRSVEGKFGVGDK